uniref:Hemopexin n=1 Tax=Scleropages formosus TaxID=113540 RepID=A0A8C9T9U7_SCLFO
MRLLPGTLCLCLALALSQAAPSHHDIQKDKPAGHEQGAHKPAGQEHGAHKPAGHEHDKHKPGGSGHGAHKPQGHDHEHHGAVHERCEGIEFDAVAVNEEGIPYFFKGDHLWKGFHGNSELSNKTFKELDDHHHLGHVDAAFRMHSKDNQHDHDHIFFFLNDHVFSFYNHSLEKGYPKKIEDVFPGIPHNLDAAVECPKGECVQDSVIFIRGDEAYHYDIKDKKVDESKWAHLPNCTSAFRWLEHYYCFHGNTFTKFHPVTGTVTGKYPKDARDYFMRCHKFGKDSNHTERETCSRVHLDAVTSDDAGNVYAFRGHHYLEQKAGSDTWEAHPIEKTWKKLHSEVDAVFSYNNHLYMIKDDNIYVYSVGDTHKLLDGYPKPVSKELGIKGHVDAAFVCADHHIAHIIQGQKMYDVDLAANPRAVKNEVPLHFKKVDAGTCGPEGVKIMVGSHYYQYESLKEIYCHVHIRTAINSA